MSSGGLLEARICSSMAAASVSLSRVWDLLVRPGSRSGSASLATLVPRAQPGCSELLCRLGGPRRNASRELILSTLGSRLHLRLIYF